jgi:hypothetical protein
MPLIHGNEDAFGSADREPEQWNRPAQMSTDLGLPG